MASVERAIYRSAAAVCVTLVLVGFWITSSAGAITAHARSMDQSLGHTTDYLIDIKGTLKDMDDVLRPGPLDVRVVR